MCPSLHTHKGSSHEVGSIMVFAVSPNAEDIQKCFGICVGCGGVGSGRIDKH